MPSTSRAPITLDAIVLEALRIVEKDGVSGVTMRSVAGTLGVTPMALYYHVQNKRDLVDLLVQHVNSLTPPLVEVPDQDWQTTLKAYLFDRWEVLTKYPGIGVELVSQPNLGTSHERREQHLRFFQDAGFSRPQAHLAWSFLSTYLYGRISVDDRLRRDEGADRMEGLRARDYATFGIDVAVEGLSAKLATALIDSDRASTR